MHDSPSKLSPAIDKEDPFSNENGLEKKGSNTSPSNSSASNVSTVDASGRITTKTVRLQIDKPGDREDDDFNSTGAKIITPNNEAPKAKKTPIKSSIIAVKQTTKVACQESLCCFPFRFVWNLPKTWPRCTAVFLGMIVPLWILIGLSSGFGTLLATFEQGQELEDNDAIMASRAILNFSAVPDHLLLELPILCLQAYQVRWLRQQTQGNSSSPSLLPSLLPDDLLQEDFDDYLQDIMEGLPPKFLEFISTSTTTVATTSTNSTLNATEPPKVNATKPPKVSLPVFQDMEQFMQQCTALYEDEVAIFYELETNHSNAAGESMSFNWNRCWPKDLIDKMLASPGKGYVFYPSQEVIEASHPDQQGATFEQRWHESQQELYQEYLPENATADDQWQAFLKSTQDASASDTCIINTAGTTWFFFTVMTTVGYGNQSPITQEGRMLIYTAGIASLIVFAAVLGGAGYILTTLFDDFVARSRFSKWLKRPLVGVVMWGCIWLGWAKLISTDAAWWFNARLGPGTISNQDSFWFAYISTSTIGLGDYYFNPEVIFGGDALKFSFLFLIGFLFLSTFFQKIAEAVGALLPKKESSLPARLKTTRMFACWKRGYCFPVHEKPDKDLRHETLKGRLETLKDLLSPPPADFDDTDNDDDDQERLKAREEEEEEEQDNRDKTPEELLQQEEEMLNALLASVQAKRARLSATQQEEQQRQKELLQESAQDVEHDLEWQEVMDIKQEEDDEEEIEDKKMPSERSLGTEKKEELSTFVAAMSFTSPTKPVPNINQGEPERCILM